MSQIFSSEDLTEYMNGKATAAAIVEDVTTAVNAWVERETKRCWGESITVIERYDWGRNLWLRHQDVTSISAIKVGWPGRPQTTLDPTGYFFNVYGRVTVIWQMLNQPVPGGSPLFNDYMEVTYTYGATNVPDDLRLAAMSIAAGFYNWAVNGNKDIVSTSVGSYHVEYAGKVRPAGNALPNPATNTAEAHFQTVKSYATRRMG